MSRFFDPVRQVPDKVEKKVSVRHADDLRNRTEKEGLIPSFHFTHDNCSQTPTVDSEDKEAKVNFLKNRTAAKSVHQVTTGWESVHVNIKHWMLVVGAELLLTLFIYFISQIKTAVKLFKSL